LPDPARLRLRGPSPGRALRARGLDRPQLLRLRHRGMGEALAVRGDVARAEGVLEGVHREAGAHPELVMRRDVADKDVFPRREVDRKRSGLPGGDALELTVLAVLVRLRARAIDRELVGRQVGLDDLEAVLHRSEVADSDLYGSCLHAGDAHGDLV